MKTGNQWSSARLRIYSKSLNPSEISAILEIKPTESFEKGIPVSLRNPNCPVREHALWSLNSGLDSSQPLEFHISKLIEFIESKVTALTKLLQVCEIDLFCGFSSSSGQGGLTLEADLIRRLTVIPISLVLDLYPPSEHESDAFESI